MALQFAEDKSEDIKIMAKTMWGEARGESEEGKIGVAWVIRNRAENPCWWGKTVAGVCLKKWQFSCWNANDPNSDKIANLSDDELAPFIDIAESVLDDSVSDPTGGATHYHTEAVDPKWAVGREPTCTIGHHLFYKDIG